MPSVMPMPTPVLLAQALPLQANGQAQLLPAGEFAARDGRPGNGAKWRLDDPAGRALAAQLNAVAAQTPIAIDYEHQALHAGTNGQPAPAAGWIHALAWRDGIGLFADVEWTARALGFIRAGEYRYISSVILTDEQHRVVGIHNAALVAVPALLGMEAVIATLNAAITPRFETRRKPSHMDLDKLIAALGLQAGATEADVQAAITALRSRPALPQALSAALGLQAGADEAAALSAITQLRTPDAAAVATIAALQAQVTTLSAEMRAGEVAAIVDEAIKGHRLMPALREWALSLGKSDVAALRAFVAASPQIPGLSGQPTDDANHKGGEVPPEQIAQQALAYQIKREAEGVRVSTPEAVRAVMAAAGQQGA